MKLTKEQIKEAVVSYLELNGETGGWGETMRDSIGVQSIYEFLLDDEELDIDEEDEEEIIAQIEAYLYDPNV
ncbi:MAG: hypothetical protein WC346_11650 [Methanogenium sp.]|jgi:hypothetical protein